MILGTHNSATGGELVNWLKPFAWVINPTSKCQDRTIQEQLQDGVKLFNLQVAFVGGKWRFSHGLALYKEDVMLAIRQLRAWATRHKPIYFQLYLDKCFWCKQDIEEFEFLVEQLKREFCNENLVMLSAWVEGTDTYDDGTDCYNFPKWEEHYWTLGWAKNAARKWYDKLPLPKFHAKRYNVTYKKECCSKFLMLDFYNYG